MPLPVFTGAASLEAGNASSLIVEHGSENGGQSAAALVHEGSFLDKYRRVPSGSIDALITSPPYLDNYHYIRNTRPQLYWLGMVQRSAELQNMETCSFGKFWQTVRSGPEIKLAVDIPELHAVVDLVRSQHSDRGPYGGPGWANYAAAYFNDCHSFCHIMAELMRPGGLVVVVIGNNVLQGIELKTDKLFAEIAQRVGFRLLGMHRVRRKRTGSSITNSSVRAATIGKPVQLYETAIEMIAP